MESGLDSTAYGKLRSYVESILGTMEYLPGGGPGGAWEIKLHGKVARVEVRDKRINDLDRLYAAKVSHPKTWDDYEKNAALVDNVFWKLVHLVGFLSS